MKNECGHNVARNAKFCPECGAKVTIPVLQETGPRAEEFRAKSIRIGLDATVDIQPWSKPDILVTIEGDEEVKSGIEMAVAGGTLCITKPQSAAGSNDVVIDENDGLTIIRGRGSISIRNITSIGGVTIISGQSSKRVSITINCPVGTGIEFGAAEVDGKIGNLKSDITFNASGDCKLKVGVVNSVSGRADGDVDITAEQVSAINIATGGDASVTAKSAINVTAKAGGDTEADIKSADSVTLQAGGDCALTAGQIRQIATAKAGGDVELEIREASARQIIGDAGGDTSAKITSGTIADLQLKAGGDVDCRVSATCQAANIRAGGDAEGRLKAQRHIVRAGGDNDIEIG